MAIYHLLPTQLNQVARTFTATFALQTASASFPFSDILIKVMVASTQDIFFLIPLLRFFLCSRQAELDAALPPRPPLTLVAQSISLPFNLVLCLVYPKYCSLPSFPSTQAIHQADMVGPTSTLATFIAPPPPLFLNTLRISPAGLPHLLSFKPTPDSL